ncbi:RRP12-like protein, partial [Phalaenopsis equestris]|uniref:RRP12-like protein n=1 Tax=Phalaenopsis equestris TaxID=78828 RepID=UPI0009E5D183
STRKRKSFNKSLPEDLLDQSDDDPLDLLDRRKTRSILQSTSKLNRKVEASEDEPEIDNDGRLIVRDDLIKPKQQKNSSVKDSETRSLSISLKSGKSSRSSEKKRHKTESGWSYTGADYTSRKAGGDLKKKGKLEPYAYWPLDRKLLNRRVDRKAAARKGMATVMVTRDLKKLEG